MPAVKRIMEAVLPVAKAPADHPVVLLAEQLAEMKHTWMMISVVQQ